jgi:hypothetical protein
MEHFPSSFGFLQLQFNNLESIISSDTFWLAVGSVGAIIALFLIYYQIRISRIITAANFLIKFESKFDSKKMRRNRRKLVSIIKNSPEEYAKMDAFRDVLDFFDDLGVLLEKKVVPIELLWSGFCYWVLRYRILLKDYINWIRKEENDPTFYCDFENLFKRILKREEKERHTKIEITSEQLQDFIQEEMRLK